MTSNSYIFLFNKECLKEQGFDQEKEDRNAIFEDDVLLYRTIEPEKLGEKMSHQIINNKKSSFIVYIVTDLLVESGDGGDMKMKIFPHSTDKVMGCHSFIEKCLDTIKSIVENHNELENIEIENISVYCIAVQTPYVNGHLPPTLYQSLSDEKSHLLQRFKKFKERINLKELLIETYYVRYDEDRKEKATNELINLKNNLLMKKDKPNKTIKESLFISNNNMISFDVFTPVSEEGQ